MDKLTKKWHDKIISLVINKLGRELTQVELGFITSREGYLALELIEDTLKELPNESLVSYLNSES